MSLEQYREVTKLSSELLMMVDVIWTFLETSYSN
jgi:hypothetical protein